MSIEQEIEREIVRMAGNRKRLYPLVIAFPESCFCTTIEGDAELRNLVERTQVKLATLSGDAGGSPGAHLSIREALAHALMAFAAAKVQ